MTKTYQQIKEICDSTQESSQIWKVEMLPKYTPDNTFLHNECALLWWLGGHIITMDLITEDELIAFWELLESKELTP